MNSTMVSIDESAASYNFLINYIKEFEIVFTLIFIISTCLGLVMFYFHRSFKKKGHNSIPLETSYKVMFTMSLYWLVSAIANGSGEPMLISLGFIASLPSRIQYCKHYDYLNKRELSYNYAYPLAFVSGLVSVALYKAEVNVFSNIFYDGVFTTATLPIFLAVCSPSLIVLKNGLSDILKNPSSFRKNIALLGLIYSGLLASLYFVTFRLNPPHLTFGYTSIFCIYLIAIFYFATESSISIKEQHKIHLDMDITPFSINHKNKTSINKSLSFVQSTLQKSLSTEDYLKSVEYINKIHSKNEETSKIIQSYQD